MPPRRAAAFKGPSVGDRVSSLWARRVSWVPGDRLPTSLLCGLPLPQLLILALGFPGDASGKEPACQCRRYNYEMCVGSLGWEDLLEKELAAHSRILAWRILMDRGPWHTTYSPRGHKESDTTEVT